MIAALPAPVADIQERIRELSTEDRLLLNEILRVERDAESWEAISWPWDLLEQRKQALAAGQSQVLPLEQVAERLRARRVQS